MMIDRILNRTGSVDLGYNATGVIKSRLHYSGLDDEYIIQDEMPAHFVQQCLDEAKAVSEVDQKGDMRLIGRLPMPLWLSWRNEWAKTEKQKGVMWRAYLAKQLMSNDYKKFSTGIKV